MYKLKSKKGKYYLKPRYDKCHNYYMRRGLHVEGQLIDRVGIVSPMIGDVKQSVRDTDYEGWLLCDGSEVPVSQYPKLYDLIGNRFGEASEGYFKLPDARGRVLGNINENTDNGLSCRCVGDKVGEEEHTLTTDEMPAHNHESNSNNDTKLGLLYYNGTGTVETTDDTNTEPKVVSGLTTLSIDNTGGDEPHNNMQPTLFIGNTFIYCGVRDSRKIYVCRQRRQTVAECQCDE